MLYLQNESENNENKIYRVYIDNRSTQILRVSSGQVCTGTKYVYWPKICSSGDW